MKIGLAIALALLPVTGWAESSFEPFASLSADGRYDNLTPGGGSGFVSRIAPGAGMRLHTERLVLRVEYQLAYNRYEASGATVPDSFNHHANLDGTIRVTRRLEMRVIDRFTRALDPREIDRAGIVTPPGVELLDNIGSASLVYTATRDVWVDGGYSYRFTRYGDLLTDRGPVGIPGGQEHDGTFGVVYRATPNDMLRTRMLAQYFVVGADAQAYTPSLGYWRRLGPLLSLDVEAGPIFYADGAPGRSLEATWHARGGLSFETQRWRLLSGFNRELLGGTGAAGVIWADIATGSARYRPLPWLDLTAQASYFRNGLAPANDLRVEGVDLTGEVLFRIGDNLELAVYTLYRKQADRGLGGLGFDRNVAGLRLTALLTPSSRTTKEIR